MSITAWVGQFQHQILFFGTLSIPETMGLSANDPSVPMGDRKVSRRMLSLDVLRGLDMFFLLFLSPVFIVLPEVFDNPVINWLANQCEHPEWEGFTMYDIVFPMFIYIVGVAMPFSFTRRMKDVQDKWKVLKHVFLRTFSLMILGLVLWQEPGGAHPEYGYYSVLYRIGFCYLFAALILLTTSIPGQVYWAFGLFTVHWLMMRFVPVPGSGIADFGIEGSLHSYLAHQVSNLIGPDFRYVFSFSLLPSVSGCLFGAIAGHWLMTDKAASVKVMKLLMAGCMLMLIGLIVHMDFPINKKLGSPSFHLVTWGISTFLLGLFYWINDVNGEKKWTFFLVVIGLNPITIYVTSWLINFNALANVFVGAIDFGRAQHLLLVFMAGVIKWLFLYWLYKNKVFIKI